MSKKDENSYSISSKRAAYYVFLSLAACLLILVQGGSLAVSQILPPPVKDKTKDRQETEPAEKRDKSSEEKQRDKKAVEKAQKKNKAAPAEIEVEWKRRFHAGTGSLPKGVVLSPDGKEAWVTNFGFKGRQNLFVFNAATGKVKKEISFPGRAVELAFSPDGKTAYVSNFDTGRLMLVNTETYKVEKTIKVGINPKIVTLSPSGDDIYVSNWSSNTVSIIDANIEKVIRTVKVGINPRGSDTDASGRYLFVANFNGHNLSVVDIKKGKQVKLIKMHAYPRHVTTTPDGKYILCSNMGKASSQVAVIDPKKLELVKWIKVGGGPKVVSVSPDSRFAFTANFYDNSVSIIDLEKLGMKGGIKNLGRSCCGMDMAEDGKTLYVTSWHSNDLWAFDLTYKPKQEEKKPKTADTEKPASQ
ncbi:MAG: YncE family protein [bacterium]